MKINEDTQLILASESMRCEVAEIQRIIATSKSDDDSRFLCKHLLDLEKALNEFRNQLCRHL